MTLRGPNMFVQPPNVKNSFSTPVFQPPVVVCRPKEKLASTMTFSAQVIFLHKGSSNQLYNASLHINVYQHLYTACTSLSFLTPLPPPFELQIDCYCASPSCTPQRCQKKPYFLSAYFLETGLHFVVTLYFNTTAHRVLRWLSSLLPGNGHTYYSSCFPCTLVASDGASPRE